MSKRIARMLETPLDKINWIDNWVIFNIEQGTT